MFCFSSRYLFAFSFLVPHSMVLQDLIRSVSSRKGIFGDSWQAMREKFLGIYGEALSSNCRDLVQMIQVITLPFSCKESDW